MLPWLAALLLLLQQAAVAAAGANSAGGGGVVRNVLLPSHEPDLRPYLLDFAENKASAAACWRQVSSSPVLQFEDDGDDSLIAVSPVGSGASFDDCFEKFEITIRSTSSSSTAAACSRALLFENAADAHQVQRVDVHCAVLHSLEITTTTRRLDIGEEQLLTVVGKDASANVFSSLVGLRFDFAAEQPQPHCELLVQQQQKDHQHQIAVRGQSTGRCWVEARHSAALATKVELVVARKVSLCPGDLVSLPTTSSSHPERLFQYCLAKRQGCFSQGKDFAWETANNGSTVRIQDVKEPTNFAQARVAYSPVAGLAHFVAPLSTSTASTVAGECAFARAKQDGSWPALAKSLPREPSYWKNRPHYYVWKQSSWVLLGLLQLENGHYATPHLVQQQHQVRFTCNDTSVLMVADGDKAASAAAQVFRALDKAGTVTVTLSSAVAPAVEFLVTVMDRVEVHPKLPVVDVMCQGSAVNITGGSGAAHNYRTSLPSSKIVSTASGQAAGSVQLPPQAREGEHHFFVWDNAVWGEAARTKAAYVVRRIAQYKFREGRQLLVKVGDTVRLHVEGAQQEHCCNPLLGAEWLFDHAVLQQQQSTGAGDAPAASASVCAQAEFKATKTGTTVVRFGGKRAEVEIQVVDPVGFSPAPGVVLTAGCATEVEVLNANLHLSELWVQGRQQRSSKFAITCTAANAASGGVQSVDVEVRTQTTTYSKQYTYECIQPKRCTLQLHHGHSRSAVIPASATHIQLGLADVRVAATVWGGEASHSSSSSSSYAQCWQQHSHFAINSTQLSGGGGGLVPLDVLGHAAITGRVLGLDCAAIELTVAQPFSISAPASGLHLWADDCAERAVPLVGGSGRFSSSHFAVDAGALVLPKHAASAKYPHVVVRDDAYYPSNTTREVRVEFSSEPELALDVLTEHAVQHGEMALQVRSSVDLSSAVDVQLDWYPRDALSLVSSNGGDKYVVFAERSGKVRLEYTVAARCEEATKKKQRLLASVEVDVQAYRSVAVLPGNEYALGECDGDKPAQLSECREVNSTTGGAFAVQTNGVVQASCGGDGDSEQQPVLVACSSAQQQQPPLYFRLVVADIHDVVISPAHDVWFSSSNSTSSANNQVHFELARRHVPAQWAAASQCRALNDNDNQWTIRVSNASPATQRLTTRDELVSVFVDRKSTLQVSASVVLASRCAAAKKQKKRTVEASKKYTVVDLPRVLNLPAGLLLLPPGAQFDVETSEPVLCRLTCGGDSCGGAVRLEGCRIHTATTTTAPVAGAAACSLSLFTKSGAVAFFQTIIEVKPIASLSLRAGGDADDDVTSLEVAFHDEHARRFTRGWFDGDHTARALEFQVPPPLRVTLDSVINCTHKYVGERVRLDVRGGQLQHQQLHQATSIVAQLRSDGKVQLKASAQLPALYWQCLGKRYRVLNMWCVGTYEYIVAWALAGTAGVLALQRNFRLALAFLALVLAVGMAS